MRVFGSTDTYQLVTSAELTEDDSEEHSSKMNHVTNTEKRPGPSSRPSISSHWAVILCILSTAINCALLLYSSVLYPQRPLDVLLSSPRVSKKMMASLRRPSQFIGFDRLDHKYFEDRKLDNFPMVLAQVDGTLRDKSMWVDPGEPSLIGMVYPTRKRLHITETVSSVMQFRVLDYAMELCEINIAFPHLSEDGDGVELSSSRYSLDLWKLQSSTEIEPSELTYNTRPARATKVATVPVNDGMPWAYNLTCESDSLVTLELACNSAESQERCFLEWEQGHEKVPAVFITQYSFKSGQKKLA